MIWGVFLLNYINCVFYKTKQFSTQIILLHFKKKLIKINLVLWNQIKLNNLKDDFFFFKFKNTNWFTLE